MGKDSGTDSFPSICLEKQLNYFCPMKEKSVKKFESDASMGNCVQHSRAKRNHLKNQDYDQKSVGQA